MARQLTLSLNGQNPCRAQSSCRTPRQAHLFPEPQRKRLHLRWGLASVAAALACLHPASPNGTAIPENQPSIAPHSRSHNSTTTAHNTHPTQHTYASNPATTYRYSQGFPFLRQLTQGCSPSHLILLALQPWHALRTRLRTPSSPSSDMPPKIRLLGPCYLSRGTRESDLGANCRFSSPRASPSCDVTRRVKRLKCVVENPLRRVLSPGFWLGFERVALQAVLACSKAKGAVDRPKS